MSGVLFVVYIPSKEIEKDIREKHAALHIENEEIKPRDDIKEHPSTPISTPEMQRSFFKVRNTPFCIVEINKVIKYRSQMMTMIH